ncbi:MAG: aldo/keto reductase [Selenomonas sp.]|nr:aldo/keto reductase [Selenomonas sp.]
MGNESGPAKGSGQSAVAEMIYREIPHSGQKVSAISLGVGSLHESSDAEVERIVDYALGSGINLVDMIMPTAGPAEAIGRGHEEPPQGRDCTAPYWVPIIIWLVSRIGRGICRRRKKGFEEQLRLFGSGDSDIGMIHYVDQNDDYDAMLNNGLLDYAVKLKEAGTIRYIGFSSHSVEISQRFLATGLIDVFMFSLNPAYDFENTSEGLRVAADRAALYAEAEKRGAAITVMKCYGGGQLLSATDSPFGQAMSTAQCVQYCLDWPAVISCVAGVKNMKEMQSSLEYLAVSPTDREYRAVLSSGAAAMEGVCIYCNHCLPCPVGINIGDVNKYYDLAKNGDALARDHYSSLSRWASDCNECGECEPRCPFHVKVRDRMKEIAAYMGK